MNLHAVRAIYMYEMARTGRTLFQSIVSPVISTSLYFIVFGAAIGSRITQIEGVNYGSFIVPGLIMLMLLTQSVTNAAFGIYFLRFVGTIYEMLSAPVSPFHCLRGRTNCASKKSLTIAAIWQLAIVRRAKRQDDETTSVEKSAISQSPLQIHFGFSL
jgi:ABC-2 type transport system permease protein